MKKSILSISILFATYASAQVGVNTENPKATLDITANLDDAITVPSGLLIPRVPRSYAQNVTLDPSLITTPIESTIIYVNEIDGDATAAATNIDTKGFYYFSSVESKWIKIYNNQDGNSIINNYNFENGLTPVPSSGNTVNVILGGELLHDTEINVDENKKLSIEGRVNNAFSVGGNSLSVDNNLGFVGVGTTNPEAKLHIDGDIKITGGNPGEGKILTSDANGLATWKDIPDATVSIDAENGLEKIIENGTTTIKLGGVLIKEGTTFIETSDTSNLEITGSSVNAFSVNDENFSVDAKNERVGIGTTTPQSKLQVNGNIQLVGSLNVGGTDAGEAGVRGQYLVSAGKDNPPIWTDGPSGGTTNPVAVAGVNGVQATGSEGNYIVKLGGNITEDTELVINSQVGGKLLIKDGGINAFSVGEDNFSVDNTNNRVGIGTIAPSTKLDVNGQIRVRGGSPGAGKVLTASSTTGLASWQTPTNKITEANNGLTYNTLGDLTTIELGGILSKRTDIDTNKNKFVIYTTIEDGFGINQNDFSVDGATNRIGIGVTSPTTKLDVNGQIRVRGGSPGVGKVLTSDANGLANWQAIPNTTIEAENGLGKDETNGTTTVKLGGSLNKNGNTEITATINSKLKINGDVSNAFSVGSSTATNLSVDNNNNRVGIGTISPTEKLHIEGKVKIKDGTEGNDKVLVSNNEGVGSWKTLAAIKPIVLGDFEQWTAVIPEGYPAKTVIYSGHSITLTKGKWIMDVGFTFLSKLEGANRIWQHMYLSSSKTAREQNNFKFIGVAGTRTSYAGVFQTSAGSDINDNKMGFISGSNIIEVTADNVEIYVLIENRPVNVFEFRVRADENYFYATPIN